MEFRLEAEPNAPRSTVISYPYEGRTANLERRVVITGERVVNAQPSFDPESGLPQVSIDLDGEGGNLMQPAQPKTISVVVLALCLLKVKPSIPTKWWTVWKWWCLSV